LAHLHHHQNQKMKITIILNGVKVIKDIPTTWHLVTFRQMIALYEAGEDKAKIISVFTGVEPETLRIATINNFDLVIDMLSFMKDQMNLIIPQSILGHKVPTDLESEAIARYGDIQEIIAKFNPEDNIFNLSQYPLIIATYVTGSPYDFKQAEELAERIWDAPCTEVMATGNFILNKFSKLKRGTLNSFPLVGTRLNRLKQAIKNSMLRLVFSIRYGSWKRRHRSTAKNS